MVPRGVRCTLPVIREKMSHWGIYLHVGWLYGCKTGKTNAEMRGDMTASWKRQHYWFHWAGWCQGYILVSDSHMIPLSFHKWTPSSSLFLLCASFHLLAFTGACCAGAWRHKWELSISEGQVPCTTAPAEEGLSKILVCATSTRKGSMLANLQSSHKYVIFLEPGITAAHLSLTHHNALVMKNSCGRRWMSQCPTYHTHIVQKIMYFISFSLLVSFQIPKSPSFYSSHTPFFSPPSFINRPEGPHEVNNTAVLVWTTPKAKLTLAVWLLH